MMMKRKLRAPLLAAAALAFAVFVFYSLAQVEPIKVISKRLVQHGDRVAVQLSLANRGPDSAAVNLDLSFFDRNGARLFAQKVRLAGLRHGETRDFVTPELSLAGVHDFSIALDHGANPYGN